MVKKVVTQALKQLGEVGKDTAAQITKEPLEMIDTALGGGQGGNKGGSLPKQFSRQSRDDQKEIEKVRQELASLRGGRDVEQEIKEVRRKKEEEEEEKRKQEEEIKKMKAKEEEEAEKDAAEIIPSGKTPRRLPPWAQKGTKEKGRRGQG